MCKRGTEEHVLVYIPAYLSFTSKARFDIKLIDQCIAPIVRALTNAGIYTISCCCGHRKVDGHVDLLDGRVLVVKSKEDGEKWLSEL